MLHEEDCMMVESCNFTLCSHDSSTRRSHYWPDIITNLSRSILGRLVHCCYVCRIDNPMMKEISITVHEYQPLLSWWQTMPFYASYLLYQSWLHSNDLINTYITSTSIIVNHTTIVARSEKTGLNYRKYTYIFISWCAIQNWLVLL